MKIIYTKKKEEIFVDDEDYEWLNQFKWRLDNGYARTNIKHDGKWKSQYMHRMIMSVTDRWTSVDHIDGNKIYNRRSNLRGCNTSENARNRGASKNNASGIKGLHYNKRDNLWQAQITVNGKHHSKCFSCNIYPDAKELALKWLEENREKLHGEFSRS